MAMTLVKSLLAYRFAIYIHFFPGRLRSYIKMSSFRLALLGRLCGDYARSLKAEVPRQLAPPHAPTSGRHVEEEEESGFEPDVTSDEVRRDRSSFLIGNGEMWTVP